MSTRTLMVLVAYVALLFGAYVSTERLGQSARILTDKAVSAERRAAFYLDEKARIEEERQRRLEAARRLRDGEIPVTQWALRRLLETAAPKERTRRFAAAANEEERQAQGLQLIASIYRNLAEYQDGLAAKYNRARRRPWLPVAPDPPQPGAK